MDVPTKRPKRPRVKDGGKYEFRQVKVEKTTISHAASLATIFAALSGPMKPGDIREIQFAREMTQEEFNKMVEKFANKARDLGMHVHADRWVKIIQMIKKARNE